MSLSLLVAAARTDGDGSEDKKRSHASENRGKKAAAMKPNVLKNPWRSAAALVE